VSWRTDGSLRLNFAIPVSSTKAIVANRGGDEATPLKYRRRFMSAGEKILDPVRMSCEMSRELNMRLTEIAENSGLSLSDVMRRAVALIDLAYQAKQKGYRLGIFNTNRELVTEYTDVL
jgi:predicted transcriptional regulator